jgi:hypothetical protein
MGVGPTLVSHLHSFNKLSSAATIHSYVNLLEVVVAVVIIIMLVIEAVAVSIYYNIANPPMNKVL